MSPPFHSELNLKVSESWPSCSDVSDKNQNLTLNPTHPVSELVLFSDVFTVGLFLLLPPNFYICTHMIVLFIDSAHPTSLLQRKQDCIIF